MLKQTLTKWYQRLKSHSYIPVANERTQKSWKAELQSLATTITVLVISLVLFIAFLVMAVRAGQRCGDEFWSSPSPQGLPGDEQEAWLHTIIVDAGSSGSRLHIYSWKNPRFGGPHLDAKAILPDIRRGMGENEVDDESRPWHIKATPGLSYFAKNLTGLDSYMETLLDFAAEKIPSDRHSNTNLNVFATAGMRLLPDASQTSILSRVCTVARTKYKFHVSSDDDPTCSKNIKIISGEEEGLFGWLSVNYLMEAFPHSEQQAETGANFENTFGFLDMGGASAQLAFQPTQVVGQKHANDMKTMTLRTLNGFNQTFHLYVTSFLGYGSNEARKRYVDQIIKLATPVVGDNDDMYFPDPCLPLGLVLNTQNVTLHGNGDFQACFRDMQPLLNKSAPCPDKPCLINGIHTPPLDYTQKQYVGISEYWYTTHDLLGLTGGYQYSQFEKLASDFCSRSWSTLQQQLAENQLPPSTSMEKLQLQCFKAAWLMNFLYEGMEMPKEDCLENQKELFRRDDQQLPSCSKYRFQALNDIHNFEVSWTLGMALLQAVASIPECISTGLNISPVVAVVLALLFICILGSMVRIVSFMKALRSNATSHDSIPLHVIHPSGSLQSLHQDTIIDIGEEEPIIPNREGSSTPRWTGSRISSPLASRSNTSATRSPQTPFRWGDPEEI